MMQFIAIIFQAVGDIVGGMVVALVLGLAFWNVFKLVGCPEWGPVVSFVIVTAVLVSTHRVYRMVPIIALFGLVGIICSWSEGAAWRARRKGNNPGSRQFKTLAQSRRTHHRHHVDF
jgi:hypothetical protein